jgi:hypothetical protein
MPHLQLAQISHRAADVVAGTAELLIVHEPVTSATVFLERVTPPVAMTPEQEDQLMAEFEQTMERLDKLSLDELEAEEQRLAEQGGEEGDTIVQLRIHVPTADAGHAAALRRMGYRPGEASDDEIIEFTLPVTDAEAAAEHALGALLAAPNVAADAWLWITDIPHPRHWPDPLPRPREWPPRTA